MKTSLKGFTMVEVVLTIALVSILFGATAILSRQGLDAYIHVAERGKTLQQARQAMERITQELKRVGDENNNNIQNIQPDRITFIDDVGATAQFSMNGQTLMRDSDPLLENVISFGLIGYKDDGFSTSAANQVRRVNIQLSTTTPGQIVPVTLRTDVYLRNYMYEDFR